MTFKNAICPHCGFESEDDEMCRACGNLLNEDIRTPNVSLLGLLGSGLQSWSIFSKENYSGRDDDSISRELDMDFDRTWSVLPSNIFNRKTD